MIVNVITEKESNRLAYVCDFINRHPLNDGLFVLKTNVEKADLAIAYSNTDKSVYHKIPVQSILFQYKYFETAFANEYSFHNQKIFSVETARKEKQEFYKNGVFGFDFFETIFFHLSRVEELELEEHQLNDRGQIREEELFVIKNQIHRFPVVDQIIVGLVQIFGNQKVQLKTKWSVTHDIDYIERFSGAKSFFKASVRAIMDFKNPLSVWQSYSSKKANPSLDPYNSFNRLLLTSGTPTKEIYFLMGGEHVYDNQYSLDHPIFLEAIHIAKERGYKIGIHPSYLSWDKSKIIKSEKERLENNIGQTIDISRQHYLHFDILKTPNALLESGIKEDSSIGFTKEIGFRAGTGFPYFLYDFNTEKKSALLEKPLVFMDSAALHLEKPLEETTEFFNLNKYNTQMTVNIHNSRLVQTTFEGKLVNKIYKVIKGYIDS